ncbi:hypothetical protein SB783_39945 [Paraburkholderia sp. SIMBA_009]|jgi:hypothetical protein
MSDKAQGARITSDSPELLLQVLTPARWNSVKRNFKLMQQNIPHAGSRKSS